MTSDQPYEVPEIDWATDQVWVTSCAAFDLKYAFSFLLTDAEAARLEGTGQPTIADDHILQRTLHGMSLRGDIPHASIHHARPGRARQTTTIRL